MDYDALAFDIGNVVLDFDLSIMLGRTARLSNRETREITRWFGRTDLERRFETGIVKPEAFFEEVKNALDLPFEYEAFVSLWNHIFSETAGTSQILRELHGGVKLLAATNTNRLHLDYIRENFEILDIFDALIASCETGKRKPHPAVYHEVARLAGTEPARIVFIDDLERNVQGALRAGMRGVLFRGATDLRRQLHLLGVLPELRPEGQG